MKFLIITCFVLLPIDIFCQTIHISGTIIDKDIRTPISMVSIFTRDNKIGILSTIKGKFSLDIPDSKLNEYLYFSSVGYEIDSVKINQDSFPITIQLTSKTYSLKEVYVMPDSSLFTLLKKAYNKIPENYPNQSTRYEVFFQESTSKNDSLAEIIEALLFVYKESYQKKWKSPGQVEIIKSRIKQFQEIETGFMGGAFGLISKDLVLQRDDYINPKTMKRYQYKFNGIMTINGRDCYEIEFRSGNENDDNSTRGTMRIDTETLAYVSFEINTQNKENAKSILGPIHPVEYNTKILYKPLAGKWYLERVSSRTKHKNSRLKIPLYSSIDLIATQIQTDSVRPIPIEKRLEYMEQIESKTKLYDPKGWIDYEILANERPEQLNFQFSTDEAATVFQKKIPTRLSYTKVMTTLMSKLIFSYGISYTPVSFNQINPNISFQPNPANSPFVISKIMQSAKQNFLLQGSLGYRISKKWHLLWDRSSYSFSKNISFQSGSLGIKYQYNLNNAGYPVFIGTSLFVCDRSYYRNLGIMDNLSSFTYNHKKFDAKKLDFSYGTREQTITPQISLSKRVNKFMTLDFFANYHFPIHSENNIKIKEKDGFSLFRKNTTINFNDNNLNIDNSDILKNSIFTNKLEIGIMFSFF